MHNVLRGRWEFLQVSRIRWQRTKNASFKTISPKVLRRLFMHTRLRRSDNALCFPLSISRSTFASPDEWLDLLTFVPVLSHNVFGNFLFLPLTFLLPILRIGRPTGYHLPFATPSTYSGLRARLPDSVHCASVSRVGLREPAGPRLLVYPQQHHRVYPR